MKQDGTYTVDELLEICNTQLQSWEREELAERLVPGSDVIGRIRNMSAEELAAYSGYYVFDEERDALSLIDQGDIISHLIAEFAEDEMLDAIGDDKIIDYVIDNDLIEKGE